MGSRAGGILPLCPPGETPPAELLQPWGQHSKDLELLESPEEAPGWSEDGAALLGGKAGRAGIVQPGEEKLWGDPNLVLQCLKGTCKKDGERPLWGPKGQDKGNSDTGNQTLDEKDPNKADPGIP
ncbi:hypothetical protein WISP_30761 [Willisornis vidua]|uniref:Uncharacterized protein n=1 Tax=Willisornis vidua TaxID=1566151 RepID=A0ABQ9DRF5_9PASS|nr:hypothetical protein WISP_30761 [Willisornis vidua]